MGTDGMVATDCLSLWALMVWPSPLTLAMGIDGMVLVGHSGYGH